MRFEFENENGNELAVSNINFYGPQAPVAEGRREISNDEIELNQNSKGGGCKTWSGPFGEVDFVPDEFTTIIANSLNDSKHVKLDGSERLEPICKDIADRIFREWAVKTDGAAMKGKWQPVVIVSIHQKEPPSAAEGEHFHKYKNEKDRWGCFEFILPERLGYVLIKFGVQWGKHAERACQSHFNDFAT